MSEKELEVIDDKGEKDVSGGCIGVQKICSGTPLNSMTEVRYCVYDRDYRRSDAVPILEGFKTLEEAKKAAEERGLSTEWRHKLLSKDLFSKKMAKEEKKAWEEMMNNK